MPVTTTAVTATAATATLPLPLPLLYFNINYYYMYITITTYIITTIFVINSILLLLSPGTSCTPKGSNPQSFSDGFDDASQAVTNRQWSFILGASMGQGCGVIKMDNSLYFNDVGPREAETSPVNTTAIKYVILNVHLKEISLY